MNKISKIIYFFIATIFFIGFDVYFTELILNDLRYKHTNNQIFDIVFVQNTGAAFSIFEDARLFLIIFSIIALLLIIISIVLTLIGGAIPAKIASKKDPVEALRTE